MINQGRIEAITSERVLKEVAYYFEKGHSLLLARKFRRFILDSCIVIMHDKVLREIEAIKGKIKEKDSE